MKAFLEPFESLVDIQELRGHLQKDNQIQELSGVMDAQKAHLIYGVGYDLPAKVIVTFDELRAKQLYEEYRFFEPECVYYPAKDLLFYQSDIRGNTLTKERMEALRALVEQDKITIIVTFDALMNKMPPKTRLMSGIVKICADDTIDLEEMRNKLVSLGYDAVTQVEHPGEFAVRGGIIDVYPLTEDSPVRVELWGDEVDSLRYFDVQSQKSIENVDEITIYPATELILSAEELETGLQKMQADAKELYEKFREEFKTEEAHRIKSTIDQMIEETREWGMSQDIEPHLNYFCSETNSILDYLPENTTFFLDEISRIDEKGRVVETEFQESMKHRLEKGYLLKGQLDMLYSKEEILNKIAKHPGVILSTLDARDNILKISERYHVRAKSVNAYNNSFELLVKELKTYKKNKYKVILLSSSRTRAKRLAEDLQDYDLNCFYTEDYDHAVYPGEIMVAPGKVKRGYEYPDSGFVLISESDIFGQEHKKRKKKRLYEGEVIAGFSDLNVGDYVVHENHGLGIYRGIEKIEVDKIMKDYIKIEYAKGGNLYILATQLDSIQKYGSGEGKRPKLNTLGGQEWAKTKSKVKSAVGIVAKELVELYALRQNDDGYRYGPDTVWQREFEETFPYEETDSQVNAIEAVKSDMMSTKIMDRLICGDVGYGKTEIAIRAAFKAVQEGKQVVYLVPTTILAQQHYNNFVQRMKDFPVNVELMCRFRTPAQQKKAVEGLASGRVDIVIGTHRVLSKDVKYKDLGLLIIDEEQRFGVTHKEKIKQMKKNIDVICLSATPIPRTLHMSLIGIRDMSVLEEAPMERMPIQTFVFEYNEEMIREAIVREMARGGQVYYVFNRVKQIADVAARIESLVPEANVSYAHGQMKESQLENIMYGFINKEIDVLVSTTIIEIGLDISNVNTIIIHDADNMGLSQLYQLRGRVGRSNRTAYAFLMYRRDKMLKEVAEKRLAAIKEFTDLGSGFKIAMRDLEIRGAGNLLGEEQHGHMAAVGYDLYCKMLNEAVKIEKGIVVEESFDTTVDIDIDAFIPPSYIPSEVQRLDIYKRIAEISNEEEKDEMLDELIDRFGEPKKSVLNLLLIAGMKIAAHKAYITEINQKPEAVHFVLFEKAKINPARIPEVLDKHKPYATFYADKEAPEFTYYYKKNNKIKPKDLPEYINQFVTDLAEIAVEE